MFQEWLIVAIPVLIFSTLFWLLYNEKTYETMAIDNQREAEEDATKALWKIIHRGEITTEERQIFGKAVALLEDRIRLRKNG